MARDINLQLAASGTPITGTGNGTAVVTEGGKRADVVIETTVVPTDSDEVDTIVVAASIDGGTNYFQIATFPQLTRAAILADITTSLFGSFRISRSCYVPRPAAGQTATRVRLQHTVAGTTPSFALNAWLEPMVSLAPPAMDEQQKMGLAQIF